MNNIAIIPARGGSKGVPKKNITKLAGYPLLAYSIAAAKLCATVDRAIVSTDSPEIAELAKQFGAEVPFLRPAEYARDNSPNIDFIRHALDWLQKHEGKQPAIIIQLLPTTPLREPSVIEKAIEAFISTPEATSLRSIHGLAEPPQKMMAITNGYLTGFFPDDPRPEYYNLPRQTFPPAYHPNGYVEIFRNDYIRKSGALFGPRILAYVTSVTVEIDRLEEFEYLEYHLEKKGHVLLAYLRAHYPI